MATAVEILFDEDAAITVRELWARLDAAGIPSLAVATHGSHRPHVTLFNATGLRITPALVDRLRPLVGSDIFFDSLAIFPGTPTVLFLGARATVPLLTAHAVAYELLSTEQTRRWPQYQPGLWIPHCSLATGVDSTTVHTALTVLYPVSPLHARIAEICAVDTETGRHTTLIAV